MIEEECQPITRLLCVSMYIKRKRERSMKICPEKCLEVRFFADH